MFIQAWNKYLPVIRILLKRSVNAVQTLDIDKADFDRASGGKKVKFVFSIVVINGRAPAMEKAPASAKQLITLLQQDTATSDFLRQHHVEFTMTNNYQLVITNATPAVEAHDTTPDAEIKSGEPSQDE